MTRSYLALMVGVLLAGTVSAQPGTLIQNVNLPVTGNGVSVGVDCFGNVYYTLAGQSNLYKMDKNGVLLATLPVVNTANGQALQMDEMGFDRARNVFWAQLHGSNPISVWHINPATGAATFQWISQSTSVGTFRDGLAYEGTDDSIWISGDVSNTIEHYTSAGVLINVLTPQNAAGGTLGLISGVAVGVGDQLYLGRNGAQQIVRVRKSNGAFLSVFASPGGARDEGLECDAINFLPRLALWSREFNAPGFCSVIELEPGTCACGGGEAITLTPATSSNPVGTPHTVTATVFSNLGPIVGTLVTFTVISGPNIGATGTAITNAAGQATFTYTGGATVGLDTIEACFTDSNSVQHCAQATKDWFECLLFIGTQPEAIPLNPPQDYLRVGNIFMIIPVTMENRPTFNVPLIPSLYGAHLYFQVGMYNPVIFPSDPLQMSNGVDLMLGGFWSTYGGGTTMACWIEEPQVTLGGTCEPNFSIAGFGP